MLINKNILLLLLLCCQIFSQKYSDYLLLLNKDDLIILNKYQQNLSLEESRLFVKNAPLQISERDVILSDGITHGLKVILNGEIWFIQKDNESNFLPQTEKKSFNILKNCTILEDTVLIEQNGMIPVFEKRNTVFNMTGYLNKNEKILRVFNYQEYTYIKRFPYQYVWGKFGSKGGWKVIKNDKPMEINKKTDAFYNYKNMIFQNFNEINEIYKRYFLHFDSTTHKQKIIPRWECKVFNNEIRCVLNEPYNNNNLLEESTKYIITDLQNRYIGTNLKIIYLNNEIIIKQDTLEDKNK
jgi:hypothetical protein